MDEQSGPAEGRYPEQRVHVTVITNPASVGWEWVGTGGGRYQFVWPRGSTYFLFGAQGADGKWLTQRCADKWTCNGTLKDAQRVANEFING